MEKPIKIYGDYGYESECLLHECDTRQEGIRWLNGYTRSNDDGGGYKVIEVAEFAEDGEYIAFASWTSEDFYGDEGQPDEAQEWADFDPDC
jgi:hypothetical protein